VSKKLPQDEAFALMRNAGAEPLEPYKNIHSPWVCECLTCKKKISPNLNSIRLGRPACLYCSGAKIDPEYAKDLMLRAGLKVLEPYKNNNTPWRCIHIACGKVVSPTFGRIKSGGGPCKYCSKVAVDLTEVLEYLKENDFSPLEEFPGTNPPWKLRHNKCGNVIEKRYSQLKKRKNLNFTGCPICSGNAKHTEADAVEFFNKYNLNPIVPYINTETPWLSIHLDCGREVSPTYNSVRRGRGGCAYCSQTKVDPEEAIQFVRSLGYRPLEKIKWTTDPWKMIHETCDREVFPTYNQLKQGIGGCKYCASYGIDLTKPAKLYLITNPQLNAHKIGISKIKSKRISKHKSFGWEVYKEREFLVGEKAFQVEQAVLNWLRGSLGLPSYLSANQMPQGGHSETVDASEIDLPTIWAKVEELNKVKE
jgi:hypothetical protein